MAYPVQLLFHRRGCARAPSDRSCVHPLCGAHPAELRLVLVRRRCLGSVAKRREEALLRVLNEGEGYPPPERLRVNIPITQRACVMNFMEHCSDDWTSASKPACSEE